MMQFEKLKDSQKTNHSKRGRLEIYLDVLKALRKGECKPTRIMCCTNLSWEPLQEVLHHLLEQKIISVIQINNRNIYSLTEEGFRVIEYFEVAKEVLGE